MSFLPRGRRAAAVLHRLVAAAVVPSAACVAGPAGAAPPVFDATSFNAPSGLALTTASGPPAALRAFCKPVPYPRSAADAHAQGITELTYTIDSDGHARDIAVVGTTGVSRLHRRLDVAAIKFLDGCAFAPGQDTALVHRASYAWRLLAIGIDGWNQLGPAEAVPAETPGKVVDGSCRFPTWPASTREKVAAKDVQLLLQVRADGQLVGVDYVQSSGQKVIDDAVVSALKSCRFEAASQGDYPVAWWTFLTFPWTGSDLTPRFESHGRRPGGPDAVLHQAAAPREPGNHCRQVDHAKLPPNPGHGKVVLSLTFGDDDRMSSVEIVEPSASPQVDEAIRDSYRSCTVQQLFGELRRSNLPVLRSVDY